MKVKVCGMREAENIAAVASLGPDLMGFIFYALSPRFAGALDPQAIENSVSLPTKRVGVFVNEPEENIRAVAERFRLDLIQLHGTESPRLCRALRTDYGVIKAVGVGVEADLEAAVQYEGSCDYLLFDTKTPAHGGSGSKFDHAVLAAYSGSTPYFLSGGLGAGDAEAIRGIADPRCVGVDINSRFETAPGMKDPEAIRKFMETIKKGRYEQDRQTFRN